MLLVIGYCVSSSVLSVRC